MVTDKKDPILLPCEVIASKIYKKHSKKVILIRDPTKLYWVKQEL
jgi:hypothetical protein